MNTFKRKLAMFDNASTKLDVQRELSTLQQDASEIVDNLFTVVSDTLIEFTQIDDFFVVMTTKLDTSKTDAFFNSSYIEAKTFSSIEKSVDYFDELFVNFEEISFADNEEKAMQNYFSAIQCRRF